MTSTKQVIIMLIIKLRLHSKLIQNIVNTSSVIFPVNIKKNLRLFSVIHFDASWCYSALPRFHRPLENIDVDTPRLRTTRKRAPRRQ